MPGSKGAKEGILHDIVGVGFVSRQGQGESIDIIDPRNGFLFKCDAAVSVYVISDLHVNK